MSPVLRSCALLVPVLLALSGCKTNYIPNYEDPPWDDEIRDRGQGLFLGVVVNEDVSARHEEGVRVERVLASSPAALAGIQPGDVLVRFGATALRTTSDLAGVLAQESNDSEWRGKVNSWEGNQELMANLGGVGGSLPGFGSGPPSVVFEVTLQRGSQEHVLPVTLVTGIDHANKVVAHLKKVSEDEATGFWIPFVIDVTTERVSTADWLTWFGRRVTEAPILWRDVDIIPVLGLVSLFRYESIPADGGRRITVGHWPAQFRWEDEEGGYVPSITEDGERSRAIH